jgi:ubiquinone/menaquinone biosynthesis C-methylase UbiE
MQTIPLTEIKKQIGVLQVAERFFDSATLFALYQTGVFRALASGPKSLGEIRGEIGGNEDTLEATLDAAVALKLLTSENGRYAADEAFLDCLGRPASAAYLGEWVAFLHALAPPLFRLDQSIRTGRPTATLFEGGEGDSAPARTRTAAMDAYARTRGIELADRLDFSDTRRMLDLACGPGTYGIAIVERFPWVRVTLLDMPEPIEDARRLAAARGVTDRLEFAAMDAREFTPDRPFDTILLSNALHMMGPAASRQVLKRCYEMLEPGGRLIVQAHFLNDDRASPRWATLLNLIQRVGTPEGRNHALTETTEWLESAGFRDVHHVRFSAWNPNSCLIGRRPEGA